MAVGTYASTVSGNNPRRLHVGATVVYGRCSTGATASTIGDVMQLCRIPPGALIVDFMVVHRSGATTCTMDYGLSNPGDTANSNNSLFATAIANNTVSRIVDPASGLGVRVLPSDTTPDNQRYAMFQAINASGTGTTLVEVEFTITYFDTGVS